MKIEGIKMTEEEILARTIYGEARGEYTRKNGGLPALVGVGNVMMNRARIGGWFGKSVAEVCLKPYQFSAWNKDDPNYPLLTQPVIEDKYMVVCRNVAHGLLHKDWPDLTAGSTHYHTTGILPDWAYGKKPHLQLGCHLFYSNIQ